MEIVEQLKDLHEELELIIRGLTYQGLIEHKEEIKDLIDRMVEIGVELEGLDE